MARRLGAVVGARGLLGRASGGRSLDLTLRGTFLGETCQGRKALLIALHID